MTNVVRHIDAGSNHPMDEIEYMIAVLVFSQEADEKKLREKGPTFIRQLYHDFYPEETE